MNLLAVISLISVIVSLSLGILVLVKNPKNQLNQLFFLLCIMNAYWAFSEFEFRHAGDLQEAEFWIKARFLWPFALAIPWHFVMMFTEQKKLLSNIFTYMVIYVPALTLSIVELNSNLITAEPVKAEWGWAYGVPESTDIYIITTIWIIAITLISVGMCIHHFYRTPFNKKKQQTKFIVIGLFLPISSYIFLMLVQSFGVYLPEIHTMVFIFGSAVVGYTIWRYDLFSLSITDAADTIVSTMKDGVILMDPDGRIKEVNTSLVAMVGKDRDDIVGEPLSSVVEGGCDTLLDNVSSRDCEDMPDTIIDMEGALRPQKGGKIPVSISLSKVIDDNKELQGGVLVLRDIRERRDAEEELSFERNRAELYLDFLGHDLGNLYQGMSFALDIARNAGDDEEARKRSYHMMEELVDRSIRLTRNVQLFSKVKTEEELYGPIDIMPLLKKAMQDAQANFPDRMVRMDLRSPKEDMMVLGEPVLYEAFYNLIHNAIRFQEGKVAVVDVAVKVKGNRYIRVIVSDRGPGIDEEKKETLLKRLDEQTIHRHSGIGLRLVMAIVSRYKGKVRIRDRVKGDPSHGTKFIVTLLRSRE